MFNKVLIANRGAIAVRIARSLKKMNVGSIGIFSDADAHSLHVRAVDEAYELGGAAPSESYLDTEKVLKIAKEAGAEAIHPGYGFLSENAEFALACEQQGIAWIGPTSEQILAFGLKDEARSIAEKNEVPILKGTELLKDVDEATDKARGIGYPVMLKSSAGGGGIGMQVCCDERDLTEAWDTVSRLAANNFKGGGLFLEKFIERARHIEVQIFGDGKGGIKVLGEQDCSAQRRNQKVLEEAPAPGIPENVREALHESARKLGQAVNYRNAGTVEFVYDANEDKFYFLEVNTRLQVEHGVTEEVFGVDLVEWMVLLAANENEKLKELQKAVS